MRKALTVALSFLIFPKPWCSKYSLGLLLLLAAIVCEARGKPAKDHQRSPPPTSEHARAPYGAVCGGADDSPGAELGAELRGLGAVLGASSGGRRAREGARDVASPEPKDDDHDGPTRASARDVAAVGNWGRVADLGDELGLGDGLGNAAFVARGGTD
eukprot:jgi/Chrpa1/11176/Chrysochromulina_OHIO_Genome00016319-RA